jgi:hypothetical protein
MTETFGADAEMHLNELFPARRKRRKKESTAGGAADASSQQSSSGSSQSSQPSMAGALGTSDSASNVNSSSTTSPTGESSNVATANTASMANTSQVLTTASNLRVALIPSDGGIAAMEPVGREYEKIFINHLSTWIESTGAKITEHGLRKACSMVQFNFQDLVAKVFAEILCDENSIDCSMKVEKTLREATEDDGILSRPPESNTSV